VQPDWPLCDCWVTIEETTPQVHHDAPDSGAWVAELSIAHSFLIRASKGKLQVNESEAPVLQEMVRPGSVSGLQLLWAWTSQQRLERL